MNQREIAIILPTLNEEETIGRVIEEIPRTILEERGYRIKVLVVDGNSADLTRQIASEDYGLIAKVTTTNKEARVFRGGAC